MTLQDYVTQALKGKSDVGDVGFWEDYKGKVDPVGHFLIKAKLRENAVKLSVPDSEDFSMCGLSKFTSEENIANLARQYYESQGFKVERGYDPNLNSIRFKHEDGREITTCVSTSWGSEGLIASVTSWTIGGRI